MRINSIYASAFTQAFIPINWLEDNAWLQIEFLENTSVLISFLKSDKYSYEV